MGMSWSNPAFFMFKFNEGLQFLHLKVFPFLGLFLFILIEVSDEEREVMG